MITPKQWLYDNGHTDTLGGRGRMSKANKALVMEAVANGVAIEGYAVVEKATVATDKPASPAKVERVKVDPNRVVDVPDMRRDERMWVASVEVDGKRKEIGFRTIDNGCGSSLGWCYCETSRVWVDHDRQAVVLFSPRKN